MPATTPRNPSIWIGTQPRTAYPPLEPNVLVDTIVIGGSMTGLTTAIALKESGATVAVIESDRVGAGVTGNSTAKLSVLQGTIYKEVTKYAGADAARIYAAANLTALDRVASWIELLGISCGFERVNDYTFTSDLSKMADLEELLEHTRQAGLATELVDAFPEGEELPFTVQGAVRLAGQAIFDPYAFCAGLARAIDGDGSHVFEMTRALDVEDGTPCKVTTNRGTIEARAVVIATHMPFPGDGAYYAKAAPYRAYGIAVATADEPPAGSYISFESPTRSLRPAEHDGRRVLIVVGETHKTGQEDDTEQFYSSLEEWTRAHFTVEELLYRWSAQDYSTPDGIPYVGRMSGKSENVYVATGYNKWGLTNGAAAGMILTDLVLGRPNPWAEVYDSLRSIPRKGLGELVGENLNVAKELVGGKIASMSPPPLEELAPGEAGIVDADGEKVAAYRAPDGTVHAVSAACTHMGCTVAWNNAETTWDCPCHGSRFAIDGTVLHGPATQDLDRVTVAERADQ